MKQLLCGTWVSQLYLHTGVGKSDAQVVAHFSYGTCKRIGGIFGVLVTTGIKDIEMPDGIAGYHVLVPHVPGPIGIHSRDIYLHVH